MVESRNVSVSREAELWPSGLSQKPPFGLRMTSKPPPHGRMGSVRTEETMQLIRFRQYQLLHLHILAVNCDHTTAGSYIESAFLPQAILVTH
jgi:hypothetical protein